MNIAGLADGIQLAKWQWVGGKKPRAESLSNMLSL